MNREVKKKWVDALRSGDYKQGKEKLKKEVYGEITYCCLGVLCEIMDLEWTPHNYKLGEVEYLAIYEKDSCGSYLPDGFYQSVGLFSALPIAGGTTLAIHNDKHNKSFDEIADLIEEYL